MTVGFAFGAGCLVVALFALYIVGSIVRATTREHARERQLLLNQLLNLAGRPWEPPPSAEEFADFPEPEDRYAVAPGWNPDQ